MNSNEVKAVVEKSADRLNVIEKMRELERKGIFDIDVEEDPESKVLMPKDIKYLNNSPIAKFKNWLAFRMAYSFYRKSLKNKDIIVNETVGLENLRDVKGGAILTCNHFNPLDSFVMQIAFDKTKRKGKLYRIIREGNYTSFGGFYGFLMRNCNTLPLSSNIHTMKKFLDGVKRALQGGNIILIYPEQSMWWNYRKPKPLKMGGFDIASKNEVAVVPTFITLQDSDIIGKDGFPVQIYTPHIGKPIYPDMSLGRRDRAKKMMDETYAFMKKTYEDFYKIPLVYDIEEK